MDRILQVLKEQSQTKMLWVYVTLPFCIFLLRKWLKGPNKGTGNKKRLTNKTVVITGGNSGIGEETSRDLARRGAKVFILCRNIREGERVVDRIVSLYPKSPQPEVIELDLTSLHSVRTCANQILEKTEKIDYLINNAGVMLTGEEKTKDGFDMQFGTNHLGHYLLTDLLLPRIKESAKEGHEPRIVNVSSRAHLRCKAMNWPDLNFQTPNSFGSLKAYAQSKLANILHAKKLARDLEQDGILTFSLHPGVIATTNLDRHIKSRYPILFMLYSFFLRPFIRFMMKNNRDGAQTTLFAVLDDSLKGHSGSYLSDCQLAEPVKMANKIEDQDLLDRLSRKFVGLEK